MEVTMKNYRNGPDYGPSTCDFNFDIAPTLRDYVDAAIHLALFIPAKLVLRGLKKTLTLTENIETRMVQRRNLSNLAPPI